LAVGGLRNGAGREKWSRLECLGEIGSGRVKGGLDKKVQALRKILDSFLGETGLWLDVFSSEKGGRQACGGGGTNHLGEEA